MPPLLLMSSITPINVGSPAPRTEWESSTVLLELLQVTIDTRSPVTRLPAIASSVAFAIAIPGPPMEQEVSTEKG